MRSLCTVIAGLLVAAFILADLSLPQLALAWGEVRVATTNLNVRAARRSDAPKVLTLSEGQEIKVDFIQGKWAALFPMDTAERDEAKTIGYANISFLRYVGKAPEVSPDADLVVAVKPEPMDKQAPAAAAPAESASAPATPASAKTGSVVRHGESEVVAKVQSHVDEMDAQSAAGDKQPVKITADRMVYNEAKRTVVFEGNVRADHLDLVLFSETLTAYFAAGPGKKTGAEQIDRIVAAGGVKVIRRTTEGRCATLTYQVQGGVLRMEGNPVLQDGDNTITGQVIKFYLKDNRSEVVGGKGKQVQAIFTAPKDVEP